MKSAPFWTGIAGGVILTALTGFVILPILGVFDTTATGKPNILDWWGHVNLENSLRWRAQDSSIPAAADPDQGFEHYLSMCLHCHGGPEASRQEWAHYMLPSPPKLWEEEILHMSDGELFSIISQGIRMTGMPAFGPTHPDEDIWNMVAFVRRLDQLTEQQKQQLHEASSEFGHGETGDREHGH
ncbi:MAG TPA: cytochrome c [Desulfobacteraceae bacterium]|nr:cytochrome c [Desulfobacteraceae bacterium]